MAKMLVIKEEDWEKLQSGCTHKYDWWEKGYRCAFKHIEEKGTWKERELKQYVEKWKRLREIINELTEELRCNLGVSVQEQGEANRIIDELEGKGKRR